MNRDQIEQVSRSRVQSSYCGDHTALCRVLGKYMMYVDTRDTSFAPHMMMNGYWESWITKAIMDYVRPGMVCADVGACLGYYTLIMADLVGPEGFIYCIEPNPVQAQLIRRTLDINGYYNRVAVIEAAASDKEGTATLHLPETHPINGSVAATPLTVYKNEKMVSHEVSLMTLDVAAQGSSKLDFVKADVEGAEPQLWEGMQGLWEKNPQMQFCFEYVPVHYEPRDSLPRRMIECGASLGCVEMNGSVQTFNVVEAAGGDPSKLWMIWGFRP